MLSMHTKENLLAFVAIAILVGAVAFTTTFDVFAQTSNAESRNGNSTSTDSNILQDGYTTSFRTENCTFSSTGRNPFFIVEPNYRLVLAGEEEGEEVVLTITVLNQTRHVNGTETRVVEERETARDELVEVSRNFFAICEETNSVFYFGEEVDEYENGGIVGHEGTWLVGENNNRAG